MTALFSRDALAEDAQEAEGGGPVLGQTRDHRLGKGQETALPAVRTQVEGGCPSMIDSCRRQSPAPGDQGLAGSGSRQTRDFPARTMKISPLPRAGSRSSVPRQRELAAARQGGLQLVHAGDAPKKLGSAPGGVEIIRVSFLLFRPGRARATRRTRRRPGQKVVVEIGGCGRAQPLPAVAQPDVAAGLGLQCTGETSAPMEWHFRRCDPGPPRTSAVDDPRQKLGLAALLTVGGAGGRRTRSGR